MRKTIYKKLRLGGIILCLVLMAAALIPATVAFAADGSATVEQDSVHFINPTAITVLGDYLYVADIVEDNKTALLCFNISDNTPLLRYTYDKIDGLVYGLSNDKHSAIYLNMGNKVVELNVNGGELPTVGKTYAMPQASTSIVDVAYGKIANINDKTVYALTETTLYRYNESSELFDIESVGSLKGAKAVLSIDEAPNYQLYYLSGEKLCNRMNLSNGGLDSAFTDKLSLTSGFVPTGMLRINNDVALYNNDSIYAIEETSSFANTSPLLTLSSLYASDCRISDVEARGDRLFILNSKNKIDIFDKTEDAYNNQPTTTIGSDMVDKEVPTAYAGFTLVRPNGYPANIVYKTNAETSVDDIITDASEYVIIDYDGSKDSHYYYVMVGDKFGWVKKSDDATTPAQDKKLNIVNNNLGDGTFEHETEFKFTTLNGVYVYELPLANSKYTVVTQTATTLKTVKVMQEYKDGDTTWYYVSYNDGNTGFVKKSDVGQLHIKAKTNQIVTEGLRKINSSLFAPVNLYATADMNENDYVVNENGNIIKLYSGDRVTLVKTEGDVAFVMVLHSNGEQDFGWLEANRLIDVHKITTNAIVGLSLLAVAIALTTVLLIIYFKRKKKIKRNNA